jgi:hypothetical protein
MSQLVITTNRMITAIFPAVLSAHCAYVPARAPQQPSPRVRHVFLFLISLFVSQTYLLVIGFILHRTVINGNSSNCRLIM